MTSETERLAVDQSESATAGSVKLDMRPCKVLRFLTGINVTSGKTVVKNLDRIEAYYGARVAAADTKRPYSLEPLDGLLSGMEEGSCPILYGYLETPLSRSVQQELHGTLTVHNGYARLLDENGQELKPRPPKLVSIGERSTRTSLAADLYEDYLDLKHSLVRERRHRLTELEFLQRSGWSVNQLTRFENNDDDPTSSELREYALAVGVRISSKVTPVQLEE